jgi:branched-subunit amino acid ABC-type transport system permease component
VLNGLAFGGLIFLLAAGLSVIFGLMDVLNLAHGSFYMLGAYVGLTVLGLTNNFWLAMIAAPIALAIVGGAIEVVFFRRIYQRGHLMQVLLTFGLTLVFVDLIRWRFGPQTHSLPVPRGLEGAVHVLGVPFATYKLFVILFAALVAAGLVIAWRKSRVGAILRAGVADREMLGLLGIDLRRVFTGTFAFGAALAGLAGVVVGPYLSVYPGMDESILVLVLVVVVVGGLGSIEGAIVGSLLVGLANAIGPLVLGGFEAASIFAVMAVVLLVRPRGLLGLRQ